MWQSSNRLKSVLANRLAYPLYWTMCKIPAKRRTGGLYSPKTCWEVQNTGKWSYEDEKQVLTARLTTLEEEISTQQDKLLNADRFLAIVDKYTDIQELTPEIVREFIDRIVVHERSERWKRKNYTQEVEVYFNFVGKV